MNYRMYLRNIAFIATAMLNVLGTAYGSNTPKQITIQDSKKSFLSCAEIRTTLNEVDEQKNSALEKEAEFIRAILVKRGVPNVDTIEMVPSRAYMVMVRPNGHFLLYDQSEVAMYLKNPSNQTLKDMITFVLYHEGSHIINQDLEKSNYLSLGISLSMGLLAQAMYLCSPKLQDSISSLMMAYIAGLTSLFIAIPARLAYSKWFERRADLDAVKAAKDANIIRAGAVWFELHGDKRMAGYDQTLLGKFLTKLGVDLKSLAPDSYLFELFELTHPVPYRRAAYMHKIADDLEKNRD